MDGEPEPDFAIARGGLETYDSRHPEAKDVVFVVEIADSSLDRDRLDKQSMYAENRIPVYWVVNLVDGIVHSYTDPTGPSHTPRYQIRNDYDRDAAIPIVLDGQVVGTIRASDILV